MTGIAFDITERKAVDQALLDNKKRLQLALNAAQMSTWDFDLLTGKVQWSENLESQMSMAPGSSKHAAAPARFGRRT